MIILGIALGCLLSMLLIKRKQSKLHYPIKVTDKMWITPNGVVDFDNHELTPAQEFHNMKVDFEIQQAKREFEHRKKQDELMGRITVVGPKKVIAMKYAK